MVHAAPIIYFQENKWKWKWKIMLFILHYNMIFFKFSFITVVLIEECSLVKNEYKNLI